MTINEGRKGHCKFVYNAIQRKIKSYFCISAKDIPIINVLIYNNQVHIWSLDKTSQCVKNCVKQKYTRIMLNNQAFIVQV